MCLGLCQEDEASRSKRVLESLAKASQFVHDRTSSDQLRKMAKHVKWSCENDFLPEESYDSVVQVMSELSSLVNTPEGLIEAAEQGATLTSDDVHWITKHMKKEEVIHGLYGFEDAETGATNGACSKKGVACDEGDPGFSTPSASLPSTFNLHSDLLPQCLHPLHDSFCFA